jgi:hypothetical protein
MGTNGNGQSLMARYYRISLFMPENTIQGAKIFLQSTIAIPIFSDSACVSKRYHVVSEGRQMWREI